MGLVGKPIYDILPGRISVGLSSVIGITCLPGQNALTLEYLSGGTLEIVNPPANINWGQGFIVPNTAILSFDLSGILWLASSGATSTAMIVRGRGQGFAGATLGTTGT
jgi:hypothetical protein